MSNVPVEHRALGLDRRKLGATLGVLALIVLWAVVAPFIADVIPYDEEVAAGDAFVVGGEVTIVPPSVGRSNRRPPSKSGHSSCTTAV